MFPALTASVVLQKLIKDVHFTYKRCTVRSIQPTEARKLFFTLGRLARQEPLLVTAATPFLVMPVETLLGTPGQLPGVCLAPPHAFRLPEAIQGPGGKSLSEIVSEGRR